MAPYAEVRRAPDIWREGWFGGLAANLAFSRRAGDLPAGPHPGRQLLWRGFAAADSGEPRRGPHGAWSAEETRVPLIALRT